MKYQELKTHIKTKAIEITSTKKDFKEAQRNCNFNEAYKLQCKLWRAKCDYRIHHIAASLIRGRTLEEIESNCKNEKPWQDWNYEKQAEEIKSQCLVDSQEVII